MRRDKSFSPSARLLANPKPTHSTLCPSVHPSVRLSVCPSTHVPFRPLPVRRSIHRGAAATCQRRTITTSWRTERDKRRRPTCKSPRPLQNGRVTKHVWNIEGRTFRNKMKGSHHPTTPTVAQTCILAHTCRKLGGFFKNCKSNGKAS